MGKKVRVLVEIIVGDVEDWDIPDNYKDAVRPYAASTPMTFFLPWTARQIPTVGQRIYFGSVEDIMVQAVEFAYSEKRLRVIYIVGKPWKEKMQLHTLLWAADEGFLSDAGWIPIKKILKSAGLPLTQK